MFVIRSVVKIILGEIFRFSESLVRVESFTVAVVLEILVILRLLLRTDDLHIIANAAYRKQGNDNKDNRAGTVIILFTSSGSADSSVSAGFSFPVQPLRSFLQTGQTVLTSPASHFSEQIQVSSAGITLTLPSPFSASAIRSASVTPFRK